VYDRTHVKLASLITGRDENLGELSLPFSPPDGITIRAHVTGTRHLDVGHLVADDLDEVCAWRSQFRARAIEWVGPAEMPSRRTDQ
jgi:hypothetical protein